MKRILLVSLSAGFLFFGVGLYLAHGEESPGLPPGPNPPLTAKQFSNVPQQYTVPRIAITSPSMKIKESKPCREYLAICERSCKERGSMFKFQCLGQDFQPFQDHFRCTCADDLFAQRSQQDVTGPVPSVQIKQEEQTLVKDQ
jgi:hypothetical protein